MPVATDSRSLAFRRGADPLLRILTPTQAREIADYHADEGLQGRIEELASKANEGELSDDERAEYQGYVRANRFAAVLQAGVRDLLSTAGTW